MWNWELFLLGVSGEYYKHMPESYPTQGKRELEDTNFPAVVAFHAHKQS
jgi:hypothetical protein